MDAIAIILMVALPAIPTKPAEYDIDAPARAAAVDLNSREMQDHITEAMALPYKYGVTRMPCKAKVEQPERQWYPAREPAGKIQWIVGPAPASSSRPKIASG
jgi:hypothetical protein